MQPGLESKPGAQAPAGRGKHRPVGAADEKVFTSGASASPDLMRLNSMHRTRLNAARTWGTPVTLPRRVSLVLREDSSGACFRPHPMEEHHDDRGEVPF